MKLKIFALIVSLSSIICIAQEEHEKYSETIGICPFPEYYYDKIPTENRWSILKTIAAGALIGSVFGPLNYATDKFFFWPINWLLFSSARDKIVAGMIENIEAHDESVNYTLILNSAWLADWISYILACKS